MSAGDGGVAASPGTRTAVALGALAAATIAWGLVANGLGTDLGTANPPFFMTWEPRLQGPVALLWLALLAGCAAASLPLARGAGSPAAFCVAITALGLVARLALAALRDGPHGWDAVFGTAPEAGNEYLPALGALHHLGTGAFLDHFAEFAATLPIHPSAHPPGMLLLTDWLGIDGAAGFATLVIAAGIAAVPLTYLAARRLDLGDAGGRAAATLLAFSPAAMLYGVASADALFATAGTIAVVLLLGRSIAQRAAGAVAMALASFLSWALLALAALSTLLVALREGLRAAVALALAIGLALAVFYAALWALTGYDPIGTVHAANQAYALGISNVRPWAYWLFGSPTAFFVVCGIPIAWYAARALGTAQPIAVALALTVLVAALLGFSRAENERIWLFFGPIACLAAATTMPRERLATVVGLLVAQAVAIEILVATVW